MGIVRQPQRRRRRGGRCRGGVAQPRCRLGAPGARTASARSRVGPGRRPVPSVPGPSGAPGPPAARWRRSPPAEAEPAQRPPSSAPVKGRRSRSTAADRQAHGGERDHRQRGRAASGPRPAGRLRPWPARSRGSRASVRADGPAAALGVDARTGEAEQDRRADRRAEAGGHDRREDRTRRRCQGQPRGSGRGHHSARGDQGLPRELPVEAVPAEPFRAAAAPNSAGPREPTNGVVPMSLSRWRPISSPTCSPRGTPAPSGPR